jgi:formiminotetrahydrofolate cyclodeaminase
MTVAIAAGLVAMVARASSESWDEAGGVAAQALTILERVGPLAHTDAQAWQEAVSALRGTGDADPERRNFALEQKLQRSAAIPLEIAELAADVAALAALAGERGDGGHRADAAAAAALAAGSARAAAHLVEINLGVRNDDPRLRQARRCEQAACDSADRILASVR